jgi:hypothetical protein
VRWLNSAADNTLRKIFRTSRAEKQSSAAVALCHVLCGPHRQYVEGERDLVYRTLLAERIGAGVRAANGLLKCL